MKERHENMLREKDLYKTEQEKKYERKIEESRKKKVEMLAKGFEGMTEVMFKHHAKKMVEMIKQKKSSQES
jgi:hypothetical protein